MPTEGIINYNLIWVLAIALVQLNDNYACN